MHDIVYVLRNGIDDTEELRYSLRSLVNFPHGKVWFFGGTPEGFTPDNAVAFEQKGISAWSKTRYTIEQACKTSEVTENFWLFNDDFFIMQKVEAPADAFYDRTLYRRIMEIRKKLGGATNLYTLELERTREILQAARKKTYNYETHLPMLINKGEMLKALERYEKSALVRSLYGNDHAVGGVQMADCKISSSAIAPSSDAVFLSTNEESFNAGKIGEYIRSIFTEPSRYEITNG